MDGTIEVTSGAILIIDDQTDMSNYTKIVVNSGGILVTGMSQSDIPDLTIRVMEEQRLSEERRAMQRPMTDMTGRENYP